MNSVIGSIIPRAKSERTVLGTPVKYESNSIVTKTIIGRFEVSYLRDEEETIVFYSRYDCRKRRQGTKSFYGHYNARRAEEIAVILERAFARAS
jgi:hypothetical protein